ncbi:MAG: FkbM family methyltransferase [Acidobacteria bacterium]|nr:FkbM family methyltransferase [Acidobacteriota bacterium]
MPSVPDTLAAEAETIRSAPRLVRYWWALRHHEQPFWFLLGRILMATGLSPLVTIQRHGFALRFYPSSISLELWLHAGETRNDVEHLFRSYLRPGDTVVDVGANVGLYTLACAVAVGPTGRVYAIEPSPRVAGYLSGNVRLNRASQVEVLNVALGEHEATLHFSDESQDDRNRITDAGTGHTVRVVRLDDLPIAGAEIALLKIDVEGYEKFVLDGATGLLPRVQCVFIETWEEHFAKYGYSCADVHARLRQAGFRLFRFDQQHLTEVGPGYVSTRCEDLLAVRDRGVFERRTGRTLDLLAPTA